MTTHCHTFSGSGFDPLNPSADDVRLEDIAHHLAMTCRYGGACPVFYSVAQHATRVARLVLEVSGDPRWALWALHHDSAEAYVHDIRRPIKKSIVVIKRGDVFGFDDLEESVMHAIVHALDLPSLGNAMPACAELVKQADNAVLNAEMRCFFGEEPAASDLIAPVLRLEQCMDWYSSKGVFLATHRALERRDQATRRDG